MSKWISVKDELPAKVGSGTLSGYLVIEQYGSSTSKIYNIGWWGKKNGYGWTSDVTGWEVTHWQELPTPPKEITK